MNVMRYTIEVASLCLRLFPWHLACQETIVKVAHMAPAAQSTASDHDLGEAWGLRAIRVEALSLCRPVSDGSSGLLPVPHQATCQQFKQGWLGRLCIWYGPCQECLLLLRHANGSLMAQTSQYRLPETDVCDPETSSQAEFSGISFRSALLRDQLHVLHSRQLADRCLRGV